MQIILNEEETKLLLYSLKNCIYYRQRSGANSSNIHPLRTEDAAKEFRARTEEYKSLFRALKLRVGDELILTAKDPVE